MKIEKYFTFLVLAFLQVAAHSQHILIDWKGYGDNKVDTILDEFRYIGQYWKAKKEGWWKVYDNNGGLKQQRFYSNDLLTQVEGYDGDEYFKIYFIRDSTKSKAYSFTMDAGKKIFVSISDFNSNSEEISSEHWFSNINDKISDTVYGLKTLGDGSYIDRYNKVYKDDFSNLQISDHTLADEQITINEEGSCQIKKVKYKLSFNRCMKFQGTELKAIYFFTPVLTFAGKVPKNDYYSLKSVRKDVLTIKGNSSDSVIFYESIIDGKPVMRGYLNKSGKPQGRWDLYHFQFLDTEDKRRTASFSINRVIEFDKLLQGDAPFVSINGISFIDIPLKKSKDIRKLMNISTSGYFDKEFIGVDQPYLYTKYATYSKKGDEIFLEDMLGYHLFQKVYFDNGNLVKGYQFSPDGKIYDSLNLNKDAFGERITKNNSFQAFPEHAMAKTYKRQLVEGIIEVLAYAATEFEKRNSEQWKSRKCSYCNKPVDKNTAIVVDGITCGNIGYPGGGIFCSNQCRYDFEVGYCRNQK